MGAILSGLGRLATSGVGRSAVGKLLPLAGDLAALTGIGVGGTALIQGGAAQAARGLGLADRVGLTPEKIAKGELANYNPNTGKLENWDLGDDWRSFVSGVSKEKVQEEATKQYAKEVDNADQIKKLTAQLKRRGGALGLGDQLNIGYDDSFKGKGGYADALQGQIDTVAKLEQLKGIPGAQLMGLGMNSSAADIDRAITKATADYQRAEASKEGGAIYEARRSEERSDNRAAIAAAREKHQFDQNLALQNHQFDERMRQRDADRQLNRELAGDKLDLAMLERQTAREDLKFRREDAAAGRRQQQMMMLIKGMSQLGAGFAL